ncbi:MAG: hypothetical protein QOF09_4189, partial [Alphaproteobacteria bacterium]|nr:hypothetical protein [Alphaproteobacteria bacterium]
MFRHYGTNVDSTVLPRITVIFRDPARFRAVLHRGFMPFSKLGLSEKV